MIIGLLIFIAFVKGQYMSEEDTRQILDAIKDVKDDIAHVQETVDNHTDQIGRIVRVIAGPMPNAINNIEGALNKEKTDFFAKVTS